MDNCRISWGKIIDSNNKQSAANSDSSHSELARLAARQDSESMYVETQPLVLTDDKLALGKPIIKKVQLPFPILTPNSLLLTTEHVSFHWNTFCGFLTDRQVENLTRYTTKAIQLANTTL